MIQTRGVVIYDIPIFGNNLLSVDKKGTYVNKNLEKYFLDK